jgi:cell wall-associated NlpC family hydrolase
VNESINRCARGRIFLKGHWRSVVQAALAAVVLALSTIGLSAAVPARAGTAATAAISAAKLRVDVWRYAVRQHGKPYIWGGTGPAGYDCSGLVYAAYRAAGVALPRTTYGMLASWHLVRISKSQARRGDLAFFGTGHVEIYDWGGWTFGAQESGTRIGFHLMNAFWHPTMYFRVQS